MDLPPDVFSQLFDASPRPMFVSDRETLRILLANTRASELYGWSRDELATMTLRDIRPPEEVEAFEGAFAAVKDPNGPYSRAARHWTKDRRVIHVVLELSPLAIAGRQLALAVITDVTGIAHAERRFRLLVEHSADGISLTNEHNVIEYVSPGGKRILGYAPEEVIGTNAVMITHPDDLGLWSAPAEGETKVHVARIRHRDGSWRWIESDTTNLTHDPAVRAFVSNYRDITERKTAERALRRSEESFRALIERAPIATFVHRDDRYVYVNPAAVAMLGCHSADEIVGRSVFEFVHPDDRQLVRDRIRDFEGARASRSNGVARMVRVDGSSFVLEASGILVDFDGQPSMVVMGIDVTERHEMFARMALADRMLSVGTLAAGVAHEINNPLAYIAANLETLAAELPNLAPSTDSRLTAPMLEGVVTDARDGVARVSAIVRDLRALSRPDDEPRGPVDIAQVLATSIKMAHNEIRHRAHVVQSYAARLPPVEAEASKLGQVFVNLLLNAAQAIGEGRADENEIRICAATTADGGRVRVDITDTGTGIPPAIRHRIFDPFFTTKAPGAGTGLGLSISHQIVRSLGGEIAVESTVGQGSTFSVMLPAAAAMPAVVPAAPAEAEPRAVRRILLVDDEAAVGRALGALLAPDTIVVSEMRARAALARVASGERFDAIVCDLMMPEVSGIELYDELVRVAPDYAHRVIFMTGGAFTPHARAFLAKLDQPHLEKPFSEVQLRRALDRVARS